MESPIINILPFQLDGAPLLELELDEELELVEALELEDELELEEDELELEEDELDELLELVELELVEPDELLLASAPLELEPDELAFSPGPLQPNNPTNKTSAVQRCKKFMGHPVKFLDVKCWGLCFIRLFL